MIPVLFWRSKDMKIYIEKNRVVGLIGNDDPRFATMNQMVVGTPPLYTGGVRNCAVIAGKCNHGDFLVHVSNDHLYKREFYKTLDSIGASEMQAVALPHRAGIISDNVDADVQVYVGYLPSVEWDGNKLDFGDVEPETLLKWRKLREK